MEKHIAGVVRIIRDQVRRIRLEDNQLPIGADVVVYLAGTVTTNSIARGVHGKKRRQRQQRAWFELLVLNRTKPWLGRTQEVKEAFSLREPCPHDESPLIDSPFPANRPPIARLLL